MRKFTKYIIISTGAVFLFITSCETRNGASQNLIINGSTELSKYDSIPSNWLNILGHWASLEGDSGHHDYGFAQDGSYYFFAGNDTLGILQQDVDVAKFARQIDDHTVQFIFSAYARSLDQGANSDQSMITITGLDISKTKITNIFRSDSARSINKWLLISDTFAAPPLTKFIRIQLMAIRHVGGDNDGYFDNIKLTTELIENKSMKWPVLIAVFFIVLVITFIMLLKFKKHKKFSA